MEVMEILLLVVGIFVVVASFLVPEGKGGNIDVTAVTEEEIRGLVNEEFERTKEQLQDISDETINYSVEKAERSLERLTNEKMMALGEYSDTILSQINTNHQETVFLHEMLNNNKNDLTVLLGQATKDSKDAVQMAQDALLGAKTAMEEAKEANDLATKAKEQSIVAEESLLKARIAIEEDLGKEVQEQALQEVPEKKPAAKKRTKTVKVSKEEKELLNSDNKISLQFVPGAENDENSNEKILRLHKQGRSNVAIAKELGLGIGEVKLVIDLFEKK